MDCQFCSIPWNVVAAVNLSAITSVDRSGRQTNNFVCVLVKNGRSLIVQSEGISFQGQEEYQSLSYEERIRVTNAETALQVERLRLIASIIDTIDFRKYRFAFLDISSPLRLVGYSGKEKLAVPSQVWLRRVPESDLQVVQWTRDRARCVWNGQQVEFFTAFNFSQRRRPEQIIKMLYQFERLGLDITAKPLAFVTREGEIIGIILEKVEGRLVEMRDCTLVSTYRHA
ncbi:hypothetical protein GYMLUDRAFT_929197 [Collybiopsis luxurians FD-317 M1]|nr:hypothetical protein GYMLUDRAFT_929197 [Collybiopsis luxurians FD-317 M1]